MRVSAFDKNSRWHTYPYSRKWGALNEVAPLRILVEGKVAPRLGGVGTFFCLLVVSSSDAEEEGGT